MDRPFPSSPGPLYQNEVKCSTFDMEMIFHSHANITHFLKKCCALWLILKARVFETRNWLDFSWSAALAYVVILRRNGNLIYDVNSLIPAGCKGELGVLMDESGSITDNDFIKEKTFVANLANSLTNFGPNGMQMAVVSYSTDARLDIKLNQYSSKKEFIHAVNSIRQFSE